MSKITSIIFIAFIALHMNSISQINSIPIIIDHYKGVHFDCVIFPENFEYHIDANRFSPTRSEINMAENALKNNLENVNTPLINQGFDDLPIIHKKLKKYKRQYLGYINQNGEKILIINCFWDTNNFHTSWKKEMVLVLDGGSYYWSVRFNLTTGLLFKLSVNGIS